MSRIKALGAIALAAGLLLTVSGCTGQGSPASSTSAQPTSTNAEPAAEATGGPTTACVSDPADAIAAGQTPVSTGPLPAAAVSALDAAAQSAFALAAAPGAIVGVQSPLGTWTAAYGLADPAANTPMAVGMHTRIASLTKMYTGTIVFQLAEQGKLSLDDTLGMYVSDIPNGDSITLRQLLNMTSGIASYTMSETFIDQFLGNPEAVLGPNEVVSVAAGLSPLYEPGTSFNYTNTNTVLLGLIIEKVTGEKFGDVLQQSILTPLNLTETSWPGDSADLPLPSASGFTLAGNTATPDAPADSTAWNPSWSFTAGEIISTMPDLLTMGRALGTGHGLLDTASQTERLTSFPDFGYGLALSCSNGWVGHTGDISGYNTSLFFNTDTDTTVAVQTNSDIASGNCEASPTMTDNPSEAVCSTPAVRILVGLTTALGGATYAPPPKH